MARGKWHMANRIIIKSPKEMEKFAAAIAKNLRGGEVLALTGELGSGKTAFVKGLAKAMGIKSVVQSPTFLLMKIYRAKQRAICHVDAYRIKDERELLNIGLQEYLADPATVTVIEWADLVKGLIPKHAIWFHFEHGLGYMERVVEIDKIPNFKNQIPKDARMPKRKNRF
jgi:tRNA threonylcarbamoyladenosine biosynthesis protein TsaE